MYGIEYRLRLMARRLALSTAAGLFLLVGVVMLAVAGFLLLSAAFGPVLACTAIGLGFMAIGLILLAIVSLTRRLVVPLAASPLGVPAASPTAAILTSVVAALALGITNGVATRRAIRRRRRPPVDN